MSPIFAKTVIQERQRRAAQALERQLDGTPFVAVIGAGEPIGKPGGLDQTYPFLPHPDYYWLSGSRRSGGVMAFDPSEGWIHFVRPADAAERLWEGEPEVPEGRDVAGLAAWLQSRATLPIAVLGSPIDPRVLLAKAEETITARVLGAIEHVRRHKDASEIALIRQAARATAAGFAKAREMIRPGVSERMVQIEMEAEMRRAGADGTSFGTIVGTGTHSAVLHFEPSQRVIASGDLVLVDSGAEIHEYCADVTRTYPAEKSFSSQQQAIYDLVLAGQREGIRRCRAGTEWHDVHRATASVMASGLKDLGILRGDIDGLLDTGAIALFFPHGVGHMVGLRVRDVGGRAPGRPAGRTCCGASVRVDMPIEAGFLMTVEPGLYFVPAILDDPTRRAQFKDAVNWTALESWRSVGGVRIEDDVLITSDAPDVLTDGIPKA